MTLYYLYWFVSQEFDVTEYRFLQHDEPTNFFIPERNG